MYNCKNKLLYCFAFESFIFYLGVSDRKFLSTTWIHIIDSGGQPEFHDLLPLFAKNTSVVIFVLNLQFAAKLPCTVTLFIAVHGNKQL